MVVLKGPSFVVLSKLSLLGASVLGYNLGSLRHGMLGQFSREEQMDSSLDLSGGDGAATVVVRGMHDSWEGGMHGRGCVGRQGVHGRGHAWHGWPPSQQIRDTMIRSMSGRYASYWNAFLLQIVCRKLHGNGSGRVSSAPPWIHHWTLFKYSKLLEMIVQKHVS